MDKSRWEPWDWFGAVSLILTLSFWVAARWPNGMSAILQPLSLLAPLTWVCLWFAVAIGIGAVAAFRGSRWWIIAPSFGLLSAVVFILRVGR